MNSIAAKKYGAVPDDDRLCLLRAAAHTLVSEGWAEVRAQHCPEYRQPQPVVVPELNVAVQPDVSASHPARPAPLIACVSGAADLRESATGRRWQALAAWAAHQRATFAVYVRPRDYARARAIAARWRVAEHVHTLPPRYPSVSVTTSPRWSDSRGGAR